MPHGIAKSISVTVSIVESFASPVGGAILIRLVGRFIAGYRSTNFLQSRVTREVVLWLVVEPSLVPHFAHVLT